jgi:Protein of unknown function (DUF992)
LIHIKVAPDQARRPLPELSGRGADQFGEKKMRMSLLAAAVAATFFGGANVSAQSGVNAGSLNCTVAGGMGFIFGSSKALDCIFVPPNGPAQHYSGTIQKFGVDIGFTKEAHIVWLVFSPGAVTPGVLAGEYVGASGSASVGVGVGANVLIGGGNNQVSLQPVSVEGSVGLNVAAGVTGIALKSVK